MLLFFQSSGLCVQSPSILTYFYLKYINLYVALSKFYYIQSNEI